MHENLWTDDRCPVKKVNEQLKHKVDYIVAGGRMMVLVRG